MELSHICGSRWDFSQRNRGNRSSGSAGIDPAVFVNLRANDCTWRSLCEFGEGVYSMLRARFVHTCSIKIIAYAYLTS